MSKRLFVLLFVLCILAAFLGWWRYAQVRGELVRAESVTSAQAVNQKVAAFLSLFVENVLGVEGEVDFETRLKLENSVRDIGDQEILSQWRAFVDSNDEKSAQQEVKKLIALLSSRIGQKYE